MIITNNLGIPLLQGDKPFVRQQFNDALGVIDAKALPNTHADNKSHFEMWQPNMAVGLHDIIRTSTSPSWQVLTCIVAGTTGSVEPTTAGIGDFVTDNNVTWKSVQLGGGNIEAWQSNAVYGVNDMVIYNKKLYRCLAAHTGTADFNTDKWEGVSASITEWKASNAYGVGDFVVCGGKLYRCQTAHISGQTFSDVNWQTIGGSGKVLIDDWITGIEYMANQLVIKGSVVYRCLTPHTAGVDFDTDMVNWERIGGIAGVGISDIDYDMLNSKLTINLTDGSQQVFNGVGNNSYGGFDSTILFNGALKEAGTTIELTDNMSNYDFIYAVAGWNFAEVTGGGLWLAKDVAENLNDPYKCLIPLTHTGATTNRAVYFGVTSDDKHISIGALFTDSGAPEFALYKIVGLKGNVEVATIEEIENMISNGESSNKLISLDTLKKFYDLMKAKG